MKNQALLYSLFVASLAILTACSSLQKKQAPALYPYKPDSQQLHDQIVQLDSIFFNAYNTCDLDKQAAMYSDSIEFYHDKGGLTTSKQEIMTSIKNNVCGKVTRELIQGSIEVYPIKGFGAIQMGLHKFDNKQSPELFQNPGNLSSSGSKPAMNGKSQG